jgi:ribonuclease HI
MIEVWTDGSCDLHHPLRPGGWAYHIKYQNEFGTLLTTSFAGNSKNTTNNQMELMAILKAIKAINKLRPFSNSVIIYSDSEWAVRCLTGVYNCKKDRTKGHVMFLNEIGWATGKLIIDYEHISAHSGIEENELVNRLAVEARLQVMA